MRICTKCEIAKETDQFHYRDKNKGTLRSWCKSCVKSHDAKVWSSGGKRETSHLVRQQNHKRNRDFVYKFLQENNCVDCNESDPIVLEFDHLGNKLYNVSNMMKDYSLEKVKAEIAKCEVVCANCHRRRTAQRAGTWKIEYGLLA